MSETKSEKFQRLRDNRLPKILHAMGLLENLAGSGYESSMTERKALVAALQEATDSVAKAFGVEGPKAGIPVEPRPAPQPDPDVKSEEGKVPHTFVADGDVGLIVVHTADGCPPAVTGSTLGSGGGYGVAVDGDYAYLAGYLAGTALRVLDVSNPNAPAVVAT